MKLFMMFLSLILVIVGFHSCIIKGNVAGLIVMTFGSLLYMLFASVKKWQHKADKSLYR